MKAGLRILFWTISVLSLTVLTSCSDDDNTPGEPIADPKASLYNNEITISDIIGIPDDITFDRVKADISGVDWSIIASVEASYKDGRAVLALPSSFPTDKLQPVDRTDKRIGYWPGSISNNQDALVAALGDTFAYNGDKKVGRLRLTDWNGKDSPTGKAFIKYIYGNQPYVLNGSDQNYIYNGTSFLKGWNAFANVNPTVDGFEGGVNCTTSFSDTDLHWYLVEVVH